MCRYVIAVVLGFATISASPSNYGEHLVGIPRIEDYNKLHYPSYDLQDLGTIYKGEVPPDVVKITKTYGIKIPQPYPVKVPYKVPYPVHVNKPYPVPVTQIVKVPHPIRVEVIKKVPVQIEVPKPYPVPANEYKAPNAAYNQQDGSDDDYGGDHKQLTQAFLSTSYGVPINPGQSYGQQDGYNSYDDNSQNLDQSDHSYAYPGSAEDGQHQNDGYQQQSGTH